MSLSCHHEHLFYITNAIYDEKDNLVEEVRKAVCIINVLHGHGEPLVNDCDRLILVRPIQFNQRTFSALKLSTMRSQMDFCRDGHPDTTPKIVRPLPVPTWYDKMLLEANCSSIGIYDYCIGLYLHFYG